MTAQTFDLPVIELKKVGRWDQYFVNGKKFDRITSVLGIKDKPQLKYWYVKQALEYVESNMDIFKSGVEKEELAKKVLKESYDKADEKKKEAADLGTLKHKNLNRFVLGEIRIEQADEAARPVLKEFERWAKDCNFKLINSEFKVASLNHGFAGTLDLDCTIFNGKRIVADLKTGKNVWNDAAIQTAAYVFCVREMLGSDKIISDDRLVIHMGIEDTKITPVWFKNYESDIEAFFSCLTLYRWSKEFDKNND